VTLPTAAWTPQEGPQLAAIEADSIDELFFGGARGGGKSDYLLGDFLQSVPEHGRNWQGILFRRSLTELQDLIKRSHRIYAQTGATWREVDKEWRWPNGACLRMRYLDRDADASKYQGHSYTFIAWDELPQWPTDAPYKLLKACLRWAEGDVHNKRIRASGNPGGPGHHWVMEMFIAENPLGYQVIFDEATHMHRVFIPSRVEDNKALLAADPHYISRLKGVGSPELVRAWLEGDWTAVVGAYFPEFTLRTHVTQPFMIPKWWLRFGAFDWGSAAPFCFGWYAVSDGLPVRVGIETKSFPKGALIKYHEAYGASAPGVGLKLPVEDVAKYILRERNQPGELQYIVADPAIFSMDGGPSLGERLAGEGLVMRPASKKRNKNKSWRVTGWDQLRGRLVGRDEKPMLYFFETCKDSIRTLPAIQHDTANPEDADSDGDDHACDEIRYACMSRPWTLLPPTDKKKFVVQPATLDDLWKEHERMLKIGGYG